MVMTMALKSKNKLTFIDGTLPKPEFESATFATWDHCNTLVLSWVHNSLDPSIALSILWMENASDVCKDMKERYYQGDIFRIPKLQEEIYLLKQGYLSNTAYYTRLKRLCEELNNFRPIPLCTCRHPCECRLIPTIREYRDNDHVIRFLKGLNEQSYVVCYQIMLMQPLPNINKLFYLFIQQERKTIV
ncbi:hypothetical protein Fmac_000481 [Flemingia macrophylla]|uniref:Retrotransposon Copia-like N-terminal domain-containing protein n=1 Tax=Flemingia macrophylla TaxID=520843 RepID=A0ABD1NED4_9FABA